MKKVVIAIGLLVPGLLLTGLWWSVRKKPSEIPLSDDPQTAFKVESTARGVRIQYEDPLTPLRALRWLPPLPNGILVNQRVTQSDRQVVSLFKDGVFQASYLVPKPPGVRDGFFRLAELREAIVLEGDLAVLLYLNPGSSVDEPPLVVALDLRTNTIRWSHRGLGERIVLGGGSEAAVYQYGLEAPPTRLPVALIAGERTAATGARSSAKTIELPSEVAKVGDLVPTGSWTFLVAHRNGLSAYLGSRGWAHHPMPEVAPDAPSEALPVLSGHSKKYWWQPVPGLLLQVLADGTPKAKWSPAQFTPAEPFQRDSALLHLLGIDANGMLWFDLATPAGSQGEGSSESTPLPEASTTPEGTTILNPVPDADWQAYASQGLDRVYSWDPQKKSLQRFKWSGLAVPSGVPKPSHGVKLVPASGLLSLDNGASVWVLPLSDLTFGEASSTGKPDQLK